MKAYISDLEDLTWRAASAAWLETSTLRMEALRAVFEDCGKSAQIYADPGMAAKLFVKAVTKEYLHQRKATTYREAV
jgi:hypothetical protein